MTKPESSVSKRKVVTSSLAAIQRPGHLADNCKMVCYINFDTLALLNKVTPSLGHTSSPARPNKVFDCRQNVRQ